MFIGTTWFLSEHISDIQRSNIEATDALAIRVAGDEARITALEKLTIEHYAGDTAFQAEMRASQDAIKGAANMMVSKMADMQVILAHKEDMRGR